MGQQAPRPEDLQNARLLTGYLARVSTKWRLFHSAGLSSYVELEDRDILGTEKLVATAFAPARTAVWIRADADLKMARLESTRRPADFLSGELLSDFKGNVIEIQPAAVLVRFSTFHCLTTRIPRHYTTTRLTGCT